MVQHSGLRGDLLEHFSGILCFILLLSLFQSIYAQDGTLKWSYDTGGAIHSSPAIGDGILDLGFNAPLRIGAFFSDATEAAQVHHAPAEASATNGLGIAMQNIGDNLISCVLDFLNEDGTAAGQEALVLQPLGSLVDFFNDSVADGFKGSVTLTCDAPVVAVAVNQDSANGSFPTDRLTIKGLN